MFASLPGVCQPRTCFVRRPTRWRSDSQLMCYCRCNQFRDTRMFVLRAHADCAVEFIIRDKTSLAFQEVFEELLSVVGIEPLCLFDPGQRFNLLRKVDRLPLRFTEGSFGHSWSRAARSPSISSIGGKPLTVHGKRGFAIAHVTPPANFKIGQKPLFVFEVSCNQSRAISRNRLSELALVGSGNLCRIIGLSQVGSLVVH